MELPWKMLSIECVLFINLGDRNESHIRNIRWIGRCIEHGAREHINYGNTWNSIARMEKYGRVVESYSINFPMRPNEITFYSIERTSLLLVLSGSLCRPKVTTCRLGMSMAHGGRRNIVQVSRRHDSIDRPYKFAQCGKLHWDTEFIETICQKIQLYHIYVCVRSCRADCTPFSIRRLLFASADLFHFPHGTF